MKTLALEVRDVGTFIPVMAVQCLPDNEGQPQPLCGISQRSCGMEGGSVLTTPSPGLLRPFAICLRRLLSGTVGAFPSSWVSYAVA